jgi:S-adenosylmethionine/arginine decarboxylase-like enzyme
MVEMIRPFMRKVIEELKLMSLVSAHINMKSIMPLPYGATIIYLLPESHLSIHNFVDEEKITLDFFTCSLGVKNEKLKSIIRDFFNVNALNIDAYYFTRGS